MGRTQCVCVCVVCVCACVRVCRLLMMVGGDLHSDWGQKGNEEMLLLVCAHGYECLEDFVCVCRVTSHVHAWRGSGSESA